MNNKVRKAHYFTKKKKKKKKKNFFKNLHIFIAYKRISFSAIVIEQNWIKKKKKKEREVHRH